jgi:hypothetical protein
MKVGVSLHNRLPRASYAGKFSASHFSHAEFSAPSHGWTGHSQPAPRLRRLTTLKIMNTPEKNPTRQFVPTQQMITAAETVFVALAYEQTTRAIVEGYQRKILAERRWETSSIIRASTRRRESEQDGMYVTDIKYAWMMNDADFAHWRARCNEKRIAANLRAETDDNCPLLVAEDTTRRAKYALCDSMAGITGIDGAKAVTLRLDRYNDLVELTLKVFAPFVSNPLAKS